MLRDRPTRYNEMVGITQRNVISIKLTSQNLPNEITLSKKIQAFFNV
jgi:hypothetical protein